MSRRRSAVVSMVGDSGPHVRFLAPSILASVGSRLWNAFLGCYCFRFHTGPIGLFLTTPIDSSGLHRPVEIQFIAGAYPRGIWLSTVASLLGESETRWPELSVEIELFTKLGSEVMVTQLI